MAAKKSFPIAVHQVPPGDSLRGTEWSPSSDRWLIERLSPVAKLFPRSAQFSKGVLSLRWSDDRWIAAWVTTAPPRQNVVLRAISIQQPDLWVWLPTAAHALIEASPEQLHAASALTLDDCREHCAEASLALILGLVSSPPAPVSRRVLVLPTGAHPDSLLRIAGAWAAFLRPGDHVAVCPHLLDAACEDPAFLDLGWNSLVVSNVRAVPNNAVHRLEPLRGNVRGVDIHDFHPRAQTILTNLFDAWPHSAELPWEQRVAIPLDLVPADRLTDSQWQARLSDYAKDLTAAERRARDFEQLAATTPPMIDRCVDLSTMEATLGLDRFVRDRILTAFCGIGIDRIEQLSRSDRAALKQL